LVGGADEDGIDIAAGEHFADEIAAGGYNRGHVTG
jgi:hypothetical protein